MRLFGALSNKGGRGAGRKTKRCDGNENSGDSFNGTVSTVPTKGSSPSPPCGRPQYCYCEIHPEVLLPPAVSGNDSYCCVTGASGGCYMCRLQWIEDKAHLASIPDHDISMRALFDRPGETP